MFDAIPALLPDLQGLYEDLHAHPELSFAEHRTAAILAERLEALGYEVTTGVGGTGVVATLANGDGPTVLLRADIDGLPVQEATGLAYASTAIATNADGETGPVAHACGHDMHATWLIGAATLLVPGVLRAGSRGGPAAGRAGRHRDPGVPEPYLMAGRISVVKRSRVSAS